MPETRFKKVLIPLAIIRLYVTVFLAYSWINSLSSSGWGSCIPELSIGTSYNGTTKTLDLNLTSMVDRTITFQQLVIKDSKSSLIFKSTLPSVELHPKEIFLYLLTLGRLNLIKEMAIVLSFALEWGQKYSSSLISLSGYK